MLLVHQHAGTEPDGAAFHHEVAQGAHSLFDAESDVTHKEKCACLD